MEDSKQFNSLVALQFWMEGVLNRSEFEKEK
jgi:hypothetical protein